MSRRHSISPKGSSRRIDSRSADIHFNIQQPSTPTWTTASEYRGDYGRDTSPWSSRHHSDEVYSQRRPSQAHPGWQNSLLLSSVNAEHHSHADTSSHRFPHNSMVERFQSRRPSAVAAGIYSNKDPSHLPPRRPSAFDHRFTASGNVDCFTRGNDTTRPTLHTESEAIRQRSKLTDAIISESRRPSQVPGVTSTMSPDSSAYDSHSDYDSRRGSEVDDVAKREKMEHSMYQIGDPTSSDEEDSTSERTWKKHQSEETNRTLEDPVRHVSGLALRRFDDHEYRRDQDPDQLGYQPPQAPMFQHHSSYSFQKSLETNHHSVNNNMQSINNPFHTVFPDPPTYHTQLPSIPPVIASSTAPLSRFSISSTFSRKSSLAKAQYDVDLNNEPEKRNPYGFHPTNTFENLEESIPSLPRQPASDYPEGGKDAWCTLAGSCIILFSTFGNVAAFGVYQDYYTRFFLSDSSPAAVSWIGSMQLFLLFSMSIFSARAMAQGYFRHCMIGGGTLYLGCSLAMSFAHRQKYYQLMLCQGIGKGLGLGLMFLPSILITCQYFLNNRPFIMAIKVSSAGIGSVIFPIIINHTLGLNHPYYLEPEPVAPLINQAPPVYQYDDGIGFGWSTRTSFFIHLALLVAANLLMKERERTKWRPGVADEKNDKSSIIAGGGGGGNGRGLAFGDWFEDLLTLATDVRFGLSVAGAFLTFWGGIFPLFYIQLFAARLNFHGDVAFYALTILNASSLVGRIIPSSLCDKFGTYIFMVPSAFLTSMLIFAMFGLKGGDGEWSAERGS
ncbi:hypothetical protein FRC02_007170, partial [Tulasnella sp. 418]